MGRPALLLVNHVSAAPRVAGQAGADGRASRLAASRLGVAAVIASHDPITAAATDRVVLMNRGRVIDDTGAGPLTRA